MRVAPRIFIIALAFAIGQMAMFYPRLPPRIASHFDLHGKADGWSSKGFFFEMQAGVLVLCVFITLLVPFLARRMPALVNLPNKQVLLSPKLRARTIYTLTDYMLYFGAALIFFLMNTTSIVINYNLVRQPTAGSIWPALLFFLLFTVVWMIALLAKLARIGKLAEQ